jgi:hypothetical protein
MGRKGSLSGGGIESNKLVETRNPKQEPKPHGVSVGAVSRQGASVGEGTPFKALYNQQAYTNPVGTNHNFKAGPGAGRVVMKAGSQSPCKPARPLPHGKPEF